jgi:hypothetical protein
MSKANEPAFPAINFNHGSGQMELQYPGISKREYFAARAPKIPDWFTYTPTGELPILPSWQDLPEGEHKEIIREWQCDPIYDLPEELMWFQKKLEAAVKERDDWHNEQYAERFFQWRVFYADRMLQQLAELDKTEK